MTMAKLSEYYAEVETTHHLFDTALNAAENQLALIDDEDTDLLTADYSGAIWKIQDTVNNLEVMANIHKFERITKEQMQRLFSSREAGIPGKKIIVDREHIVTAFDTTRTISQKYNTTWTDIQDYNDIMPSELVTGMTIRIPVEIDLSVIASKDISTFGGQQGNDILGKDLPNELIEASDGDLLVLEPVDTLKQAVENYIKTEPGTLPFYEDIGFNPKLSDEYSGEEAQSMIQLRLMNALSVDNRIKNIAIVSSEKVGNVQNITLSVEAISGESISVTGTA